LRGNDSISINNQFDSDLETFGFTGVKVDYDTKFLVATAAEIKEYTVERNDVKIDGIRYSSPELRYSNIKKTKVEIRIEPENPYIVYAFVKNRWITCMGTGAIEFQQKIWLNQQVETMKLRGVGSLKDVAKEKGNDELAALLAQADENLQKVSAENSDDEENKKDTVINNLFETMSDENKILETENWEI
jgi:putative transposase